MGQGKDDKKGRSVANAAVATASVALGYAALELGLKDVLKPGREAIQKSLEPEEEQAASSEVVKGEDHDAQKQVQVQGNTTQAPDTAASLPQHAAATAASSPIEQEEQKQQ